MYGGVVASQKQSRGKTRAAHRENEEEKAEAKKRGFKDKILAYVKRRLNPPPEEECEDTMCSSAARHRPEPLGALAASTRFSTHEIKLMYRGFKQECPSGVVDEDAFKHIFSQFFPLGDATQYAHLVFNTIKHKQSGKINFEDFLEILSRVARGSVQEKLSWVFTLYDVDGDGRISRAEMLAVVQAIYELVGRAAQPPVQSQAAKEHVDRIFNLIDTNADGVVTPDELARWCSRDPALLRSLDTLDTVFPDYAQASCSTAVDAPSMPPAPPRPTPPQLPRRASVCGERRPPPAPARVATATTITEETNRKTKYRHRRASSPQLPR